MPQASTLMWSIEDDMLQRWTILPASRLVSKLRPAGDWVITENAPVNEALDSRTAIGLTVKIRSDGVRRTQASGFDIEVTL